MSGNSLLRTSSAGAITTSQFLESLQKIWTKSRLSSPRKPTRCSIPYKLGLAVSGGADSMALAYLCKQLERSKLIDGLSVLAFVVDHKAREESSREAGIVAGWLDDMGLKSQILELDWSSTSKSAFETHARRLRFQAIGQACRDNHISTLLMGHHQDDNVETTIWRLASGARGAGLAGIPAVARIPECHGIYGVSGSGESVTLRCRRISEDGGKETIMSNGGICIARPFLPFPKTNLLATCHEHNIPYVSDPTNFDPTLTPRNAIRSLLSENRFPKALQAPSILSLIQSSQNLLKKADIFSNRLLEQCKLSTINFRTGTMNIRFPTPSPSPSSSRQIQALTLRRITDLISPHPDNHFPLLSFEPFTDHIFSPTPTKNQLSFTLGGVIFQPQKQPNTWTLSRQPFMRHRLPTLRFDVPIPTPPLQDETHTSWTLWDNRYWFRFSLASSTETTSSPTQPYTNQSTFLILRPLQKSDLHRIRSPRNLGAQESALKRLMKFLSREAPGQSRFTLPVLVMEDSSGQDHLLALPTLDFRFPSHTNDTLSRPQVKWEWMYKMIDKEPLSLMGWLDNDI